MTEEEAKTKPCIGPVPGNTGEWVVRADNKEIWVCSGSACMAWRWEVPTLTRLPDDHGHCGLVGKP